jgi:hypothetical protein
MGKLWLSILGAAACGHNTGVPVVDGGVAPDSAAARDVRVTTATYDPTQLDGTPVAGVIVVALDDHHALEVEDTTDATGELTLHDLAPGSSLTVVYPDLGTQRRIMTVLDVKPGDHLQFGKSRPIWGNPTFTVTITVPALAGATRFDFNDGCSSATANGTTVATIGIAPECNDSNHGVVAVAYDSANRMIASAYVAAPNVAANATIAIPAWTANATGDITLDISGLPAEITRAAVDIAAIYPAQIMFDALSNGAPTAGAYSAALTIPHNSTRMVATAYISNASNNTQYSTVALDPRATESSFEPPVMPWVDTVVIRGASVTWHVSGAAIPDAGLLAYQWSGPAVFTSWFVIMPWGPTSLDLSDVPAPLAQYLPSATDSPNVYVTYVDLASATSYVDVRALPSWQLEDPQSAVYSGAQSSVQWASNEGE